MTPETKQAFDGVEKLLHEVRADLDVVKAKSADFLDNERQEKMKAELAKKFAAEEKARNDLAARLEHVETLSNRPGAPGKDDTPAEAKAFNDYLRKGTEAPELKSMSTQVSENGGYMVQSQMEAGIRERLRRSSPVRQVANVVSLDGNSYDIMVERGDAGAEWAGESSTRNETDTPTINRISIALHELSAQPKITQRLLDNATFDVEGWLTGYVADKFSRTEATAFVSGDGDAKPKGFLSYGKSTDADASRAVETLQYRVTGASGAFATTNPADVLTKAFYDLHGVYQSQASWMMRSSTAAETAVLKDGNGNYLIQGMMNAEGQFIRTIQGRPVFMAEDMPAIGANSYSIAVGDFGRGYTIVDGQAVTVLRDPFSAKPNVLFYTIKRVGGGLAEADAIKLIKFGAA